MPPDSRSSSCSGPPSSTPGFDGGAGRTTWHVGSEHSAAYHTNKVCSPWGPPGMASFVRTHPPMSVGAEESTPKSFCSVMDSSLISIDAFCQPTRAPSSTYHCGMLVVGKVLKKRRRPHALLHQATPILLRHRPACPHHVRLYP